MKIEYLMDKERRAQYQLLLTLYQSDKKLSLKEVMTLLKISKVTLIKYIENLNALFQESHLAYQLILANDFLLIEEEGNITWEFILSVLLKDALSYRILLYLLGHEHFNITSLSEDFLVSEATFNRSLAHINKYLEEFDIAIWQGKQIGSELQWRYFFFELLTLSFSKQEMQAFNRNVDQKNLSLIAQRFLGLDMTENQLEKLSLWLAISQRRLSFNREKSFSDQKDLDFIEKHVFFKRLEKVILHYLRRYAIEYDTFEAKSLFIFLQSYAVLPVPSMEYILGFGGPIADKISESLWLLRRAHIIGHRTKEEIIYNLGLYFSRTYFFKGAILNQEFKKEKLLSLRTTEDREKIEVILRHLLIQAGDHRLQDSDLASYLSYKLLELIIFSIERQHKVLKVGLDFGHDVVENAMAELTIRKHLEDNGNFIFAPYQKGESFDCLISYRNSNGQGNLPYYQLKSYTWNLELEALEQFLKKELGSKNKEEDSL
ncbi:helix-turn-helix domain-containing protein [Streptococcus catagoni]|uniref:helix-turn-helix domain-containing protein n=1 Tax=Streptococcus catagoni TaxID=2654874 RepID=UPI001F2E845C|nr:helix-turn-helix domain-containing protein [Streptococcus catagoni]